MERPPVLLCPWRAGFNPFGEYQLFRGWQGAIGWHLAELDATLDSWQACFEGGFPGGEVEAGGLGFWVVAGGAAACEDGGRVDGQIGGEGYAGGD